MSYLDEHFQIEDDEDRSLWFSQAQPDLLPLSFDSGSDVEEPEKAIVECSQEEQHQTPAAAPVSDNCPGAPKRFLNF